MKKTKITVAEFANELRRIVQGLNELLQSIANEEHLDRMLTITEASRLLSRSRVTIYKLITDGLLAAYRIPNGRMRVRYSDVLDLVNNRVEIKYQSNEVNPVGHGG